MRLDSFLIGAEYEVGNTLGALLLAEGWAEPLPLDAPPPYLPFSENDPFIPRVIDRLRPGKPIRKTPPPSIRSDKAADAPRRRRTRR